MKIALANRPGLLPAAAIIACALNIRPTAVAVGPVLLQLRQDLAMSEATAGFLVSLPNLCFALFGAIAGWLTARWGLHRVTIAALGAMVAGQIGRTFADSALSFCMLSAVALAGMAVANVLLPSLVKQHFPNRIGPITAAYSVSLTIGVTVTGAATVPLASALGGWRYAFWVYAAAASTAIPLWLALAGANETHSRPGVGGTWRFRDVARTRLGWAMVVFFGFQSMQAYTIFGWLPTIYVDAGLSAEASGVMLGIATGVGIPLAFGLPAYVARVRNPTWVLVVIVIAGISAYLGLMFAPGTAPWLWACLVAVGTSSFPMILALLGLRARTAAGTVVLSGFTQSVGYLLASVGPITIGVIYGVTGGWTLPLAAIALMQIPMFAAGLYACRPKCIEDQLPVTRSGSSVRPVGPI